MSTNGMAWARTAGTTTITASDGSVHGSAVLTVTAAPLISISITPSSSSLPAGTSLQLTAVGNFQDGSTQNLTDSVTWTTSAPAVASVSGTGLLLGAKAGTVQVFATQGLITGAASITVKAAVLVSLAVTPGRASIANQTTQQFSAIGQFSDGSTQDVTSTVSWTSSPSSVATVQAGLAYGQGPGSATITASSGSITASASLTVTNSKIVSIAVSPANPSLVVGLYLQFTATGTFDDGTTQNISGVVNWTSSVPAVAATNTAGLVSGNSAGSAIISAAFEQVTGSSILSVQAPSLVSISISPGSATIAVTTVQSFFVIGNYDDGSTHLLSNASWSSSDPGVASMSGNVAVSQQPGTTTISAVVGSLSASATLTVTSATLVSIAVTPANRSMAPGTTKTFSAIGTFSDGSTQNISQLATWGSSNPAAATMNAYVATAVASGTTTVSASFDSVTGSTGLTVTQASLTSIAIGPGNPSLILGSSQQMTATGTFSDGSTQDMTALVTWNSSQTTVAIISKGGTVTAQSSGTTTISASYGSVSGSTSLTVNGATLVSLAVSPTTAAIPPGQVQQFAAIGTFSDGTVQTVTINAHWASSDSTVATVSNDSSSKGQVSALSTGWTRISAVLNSIVASAVVNVNSAKLTSLSISPANPSLSLGSNLQFTAIGTFSDGSTQDMTAWVSWSSSNAQVCVVNSSGYVASSGTGTATITASFSSVSATTTLTVY